MENNLPKSTIAVGTVLIVDDDRLILTLAEKMLASLEFTVLKASDGVEALEVFKRNRSKISCVLCDVFMPRMNGWKTLSALRDLDPRIPVIISSGDITQAHVNAGSAASHVFLPKPYRKSDLKKAINQALGR